MYAFRQETVVVEVMEEEVCIVHVFLCFLTAAERK